MMTCGKCAWARVPHTSLRSSVCTMATHSCLCHLCQSSVPSAHAVCLFGPTAVRQNVPSRISYLLDAENNGYPEHICEKCKGDWNVWQRIWRNSQVRLNSVTPHGVHAGEGSSNEQKRPVAQSVYLRT